MSASHVHGLKLINRIPIDFKTLTDKHIWFDNASGKLYTWKTILKIHIFSFLLPVKSLEIQQKTALLEEIHISLIYYY